MLSYIKNALEKQIEKNTGNYKLAYEQRLQIYKPLLDKIKSLSENELEDEGKLLVSLKGDPEVDQLLSDANVTSSMTPKEVAQAVNKAIEDAVIKGKLKTIPKDLGNFFGNDLLYLARLKALLGVVGKDSEDLIDEGVILLKMAKQDKNFASLFENAGIKLERTPSSLEAMAKFFNDSLGKAFSDGTIVDLVKDVNVRNAIDQIIKQGGYEGDITNVLIPDANALNKLSNDISKQATSESISTKPTDENTTTNQPNVNPNQTPTPSDKTNANPNTSNTPSTTNNGSGTQTQLLPPKASEVSPTKTKTTTKVITLTDLLSKDAVDKLNSLPKDVVTQVLEELEKEHDLTPEELSTRAIELADKFMKEYESLKIPALQKALQDYFLNFSKKENIDTALADAFEAVDQAKQILTAEGDQLVQLAKNDKNLGAIIATLGFSLQNLKQEDLPMLAFAFNELVKNKVSTQTGGKVQGVLTEPQLKELMTSIQAVINNAKQKNIPNNKSILLPKVVVQQLKALGLTVKDKVDFKTLQKILSSIDKLIQYSGELGVASYKIKNRVKYVSISVQGDELSLTPITVPILETSTESVTGTASGTNTTPEIQNVQVSTNTPPVVNPPTIIPNEITTTPPPPPPPPPPSPPPPNNKQPNGGLAPQVNTGNQTEGHSREREEVLII
jgi:hypothetical protein